MFLVLPGTWRVEMWTWNLKADVEASGEEQESRRRPLARVDLKTGLGAGDRCREDGHTGSGSDGKDECTLYSDLFCSSLSRTLE